MVYHYVMLHHAYIVSDYEKENWLMPCIIGLIFIVGLIVSWLVAENGFPSAINKTNWLGFLEVI